ncbi:Y-family DNA polymerase [Pelomonas sp. V22]|uniref:Y-family DNA polymerase n=1 Tax=Pelomonas sp. V22 TaxID=2822139 RepID=UPI0024A7D122|nr:Y-family DNA polymerase [Pelomonas sp. V22]MDI4635837.1 Y-family DNA polymerase [Pelomonas sp. V22]
MFALVDGNNFYCSCERVFRPSLVGKPIVVLSNNDGCAIARSNEAKDLGVKMAQPWFQIRDLERTHGLVALSANFQLYGDLSDRMMTAAGSFAPRQEIYSIDESFLDFTGVNVDLVATGHEIHERVLRWTGIPTCVGFGPTKTLAKLANHIGKTAERKPGSYPSRFARVCNLGELAKEGLDELLAATAVGEVWGVGRRIGAQLVDAGVKTVLDLARLDPATVRNRFSVVLEKTVRELQGIQCIGLDDAPAAKQQIMCSRSFGKPVTRIDDLVEAVTEFASRAAEKLRGQESAAGALMVFIRTSPFRAQDAQYSSSVTVPLARPTGDSNLLVASAVRGLRAIYREGFRYAKAGVMLVDLQPQELAQGELDLFGGHMVGEEPKREARDRTKLMAAMDAVNQRYGRGSLLVGSAGLAADRRAWSMKQDRRTPRYTTCWEEMPIARA